MTPLGQKVAAARQNYEESIGVMNRTFLEVSEATEGIGLPAAIHVPMEGPAESPDIAVKTEFLSYASWRDVWQLCYSTQYDTGSIKLQKPILDCSLRIRVLALKVLPDFVRELYSSFEKQAEEITNSVDDAFLP